MTSRLFDGGGPSAAPNKTKALRRIALGGLDFVNMWDMRACRTFRQDRVTFGQDGRTWPIHLASIRRPQRCRLLVQKVRECEPAWLVRVHVIAGRQVRDCHGVIIRRYRNRNPAYDFLSSVLWLVSTPCHSDGKVAVLPLRYRQGFGPHGYSKLRGSRIRLAVQPSPGGLLSAEIRPRTRYCGRAGTLGRGVVEDRGSG